MQRFLILFFIPLISFNAMDAFVSVKNRQLLVKVPNEQVGRLSTDAFTSDLMDRMT